MLPTFTPHPGKCSVGKLDEGTHCEFQKELAGSVAQFRKLLRSVDDGNVDVLAAGHRVMGGWESIINTTAESSG